MANAEINIDDLVVLIRERKKEGFDHVYRKYAGALYGIIYRIVQDKVLAENLLEITYVSIFADIGQYNKSITFFTWMMRKTQAVCLAHRKQDTETNCTNTVEMMLLNGQTCEQAAKEMNVPAGMIIVGLREQLKTYRNPV